MSATEIHVGQLCIRYLVDGSGSASLGMFELTVPPGSSVPPPHSHTDNEEVAAVIGAGGPPDKAALVAVMRRHGLVPAAPG